MRTFLTPSLPGRWRLSRRVFTALAALALVGLLLLTHALDLALWLQALLLGLAALGLLQMALWMARITSIELLDDLHKQIARARDTQGVPALETTGWPAFDALTESITLLASEQAQHAAHMADEARWYRGIADDALGLEAFFSPRGRLLWLNTAAEGITGYTLPECFEADDLIDLWVYSKDRNLMKDLARRGLEGEDRQGHELRLQHRNGSLCWFACRWNARRDADGQITGIRFSAQDIQRRKDVELKLLETVAALRRTQALKEHYLKRSNDEKMRLASLLDTVAQGILFVDRDRRVVYVNQPCVEMWHLPSREAVTGTRDEQIIDDTRALRDDDAAYMRHIETIIASHENSAPWDIALTDGRIINEVSAIVPSADGTQPIGRVWVFEDVTEARQIARRLTDLAERDPLTGLYNRRRFVEELERRIADAQRRDEALGMLSFDLDGFKHINDSYGHQAGDTVLTRLASEIGAIVRRNELFFRLGGDEFAILAANADIDRMEQLARRVLARASDMTFDFAGSRASITVSIGIAAVPWHAHDAESLIAAADRAMYQAKALGKNRCEIALPL